MTVAVLKNRILDLTRRAFSESAWGAQTIREFVEQFPEVVSLDLSTKPPTVELVTDPPETGLSAPRLTPSIEVSQPRRRIRPDLWRAVLDYSSGDSYVWDGERAIPVPTAEQAVGDDRLRLPTITFHTIDEWREQFVAEHVTDLPAHEAAALEKWQKETHTTSTLPPRLRGPWNGELKRRVLELVESWFASNSISAPADLVETEGTSGGTDTTTQSLRRLVIECVRVMTQAELEGLPLPASVVLRARDEPWPER